MSKMFWLLGEAKDHIKSVVRLMIPPTPFLALPFPVVWQISPRVLKPPTLKDGMVKQTFPILSPQSLQKCKDAELQKKTDACSGYDPLWCRLYYGKEKRSGVWVKYPIPASSSKSKATDASLTISVSHWAGHFWNTKKSMENRTLVKHWASLV